MLFYESKHYNRSAPGDDGSQVVEGIVQTRKQSVIIRAVMGTGINIDVFRSSVHVHSPFQPDPANIGKLAIAISACMDASRTVAFVFSASDSSVMDAPDAFQMYIAELNLLMKTKARILLPPGLYADPSTGKPIETMVFEPAGIESLFAEINPKHDPEKCIFLRKPEHELSDVWRWE